MAGNKGRKGLDQPARNTLSALDRALLDLIEKPMQPDEFTVDMLRKKDPSITSRQTVVRRLEDMVSEGKMSKRKLSVNGKQANVYRYVG